MKTWLLLSTFIIGIFVMMIPEGANAAGRYEPYRRDNSPVSRFYDPAPALTGDYYDRTSQCRPEITIKRGGPNSAARSKMSPQNMQRNMSQRPMR